MRRWNLRRQLGEATGLPCTTMSHAIVASLRQLGVRRVRELEDTLGLPATASSPAGFWDLVRLAGADASALGRLFAA